MKTDISKISTKELKRELKERRENEEDNAFKECEDTLKECEDTLKELGKKYERLTTGRKIEVPVAGLVFKVHVCVEDDEVVCSHIAWRVNKDVKNTLETQLLKMMFDTYYDNDEIYYVNDFLNKNSKEIENATIEMKDELEKIFDVCREIAKKMKCHYLDVFWDYVVG